ncbi:6-carboxytetrahydropterin synthase [bacterium]|nr:6-carboxytetrahydropterin synthase [bacterium]
MNSLTKLSIQYSHRFLNYEGEAQYLHGHTGHLKIEVKGEVDKKTGFVYPCNKIKKIAWSYLMAFDHATVLQEEDPILPELIKVYEKQGIFSGAPSNTMLGKEFDIGIAKSHPKARIVVVKKPATCENMLEIFYELMKNELNIKSMKFKSGDNAASFEY